MKEQLTFDVRTPAARASDPVTSDEAADAITKSGERHAQQERVARAVLEHPGLTSLELASSTGLDRYMIARRLSECETGKSVRRGEIRICNASGRRALTWWPAA